MFRKFLISAFCVLTLILFSAFTKAAPQFLNIATGPTGGVYYPVGAAMAKIWIDNIKDLKASAQSTGGTFNNIALLGKGETEACFADGLYYDTYFGKGLYENNPQKFLRGMVVL